MRLLLHSPRALAALVLALFVAGQFHGAVHRALVPHVVCAVDGRVAHGHAHEHDHDEGRRNDEGPRLEGTDARGEHAEHCDVIRLDREQKVFLHIGSDLRLVEPVPPGLRRLLRAERASTGIPVYLLAPKQSPPRAA